MAPTWVDYEGREWPAIASARRLRFKYPLHAAVRRHVYHRDGYRCVRCRAAARDVPTQYDGRYALPIAQRRPDGSDIYLVLDHSLTLLAGGLNIVENLFTMCETCNGKKIPEDIAARQARGLL